MEPLETYHHLFGVSNYHERHVHGEGVKMYFVDTGFQTVNEDLKHVTVENFSAAGSTQSHGAFVCSLVAAPSGDNYGIDGIASKATIYLGDVDDETGKLSTRSIVRALQSAVDKNVDIISISICGDRVDGALKNVIQQAVNKGILVFAAAGNESNKVYQYPASFPGVISVGSCNALRVISSFSTVNDSVVLFAPGENIPLPDSYGNSAFVSGTSIATPFAAGLAALALSEKRTQLNDSTFRYSRMEILQLLRKNDHLGPQPVNFTLDDAWTMGHIVYVLILILFACAIVTIITTVMRD